MSEIDVDGILERIYKLRTTVENYHDLKILYHAIENKVKSMQKELKDTYPIGKHEIDNYVLLVQNIKRTVIDYEKAKKYPDLQKTIDYTIVRVFKKQVK